MNMIKRDPALFDVFNAFADDARLARISLHEPKAVEDFIDRIRTKLASALTDDKFLHGQRTQSMFLATVASIGHVKLIKEEDAGDAVVPDNALHIPDFRVVLEDARQLLVEVKNTHPKDPLAPIRIKTAYLDGLIAYAGLTGGELLVATYWSKWNLWTLVAPHAFGTDGQYQVVSMPEAMMHNRMADLGDVQIATRPPLRLRLTADIQKVRSIDASGQVEFTISALTS